MVSSEININFIYPVVILYTLTPRKPPKSSFIMSDVRYCVEGPAATKPDKKCYKLFFSVPCAASSKQICTLFPKVRLSVYTWNYSRLLIARHKICRNRGIICRPIPANFMGLCIMLCRGWSPNFTTPSLSTTPFFYDVSKEIAQPLRLRVFCLRPRVCMNV